VAMNHWMMPQHNSQPFPGNSAVHLEQRSNAPESAKRRCDPAQRHPHASSFCMGNGCASMGVSAANGVSMQLDQHGIYPPAAASNNAAARTAFHLVQPSTSAVAGGMEVNGGVESGLSRQPSADSVQNMALIRSSSQGAAPTLPPQMAIPVMASSSANVASMPLLQQPMTQRHLDSRNGMEVQAHLMQMHNELNAASVERHALESEFDLHKTLLDMVPCAIFVRDARRGMRYINRVGLQLMGMQSMVDVAPWQIRLKASAGANADNDACEADLPGQPCPNDQRPQLPPPIMAVAELYDQSGSKERSLMVQRQPFWIHEKGMSCALAMYWTLSTSR